MLRPVIHVFLLYLLGELFSLLVSMTYSCNRTPSCNSPASTDVTSLQSYCATRVRHVSSCVSPSLARVIFQRSHRFPLRGGLHILPENPRHSFVLSRVPDHFSCYACRRHPFRELIIWTARFLLPPAGDPSSHCRDHVAGTPCMSAML